MSIFGKRTRGRSRIQRTMLTVAISCLIPLLLMGMYQIWNSGQMLNRHYLELLEADNRRVKSVFSEATHQAYTAAEQIWFDSGLSELLQQEFESKEAFIAAANEISLMDDLVYQSQVYARVTIYTDNPGVSTYKQFRFADDAIRMTDWYRQATEHSGAFWTSIDEGNSPVQNSNLSLVRPMYLPGSGYKAVAVLTLSDSYIRGAVDFGGGIDIISVDQGNVVYSSRSAWYGSPNPMDIDYDESYFRSSGRQELEGSEYFAVVSTLHLYMTNSKMYICTIDSSGITNMNSLLTQWIALLVLSLLIPLAVLVLGVRYFSGRVSLLRGEIRKARSRDYDMAGSFSGNDELTEVYEDLCHMAADIKRMDARMYEAELNEKELRNTQQLMEYKMLASQINPHYLYNTLETIRMKALAAGDREVADSIKLLGKTLHYVLENTGTVFTTLRKELDHITNYLTIQKLRFGSRINYEISIADDVDCSTYPILPLLLQPVVENAVVHGLEAISGTGMLHIRIERDGTLLRIRVSNNGAGMTEEELAQLRQALEGTGENPGSGIALRNIRQRIRLRYGEGYGITIDSAPDAGTTVTLTLPAEVSGTAG